MVKAIRKRTPTVREYPGPNLAYWPKESPAKKAFPDFVPLTEGRNFKLVEAEAEPSIQKIAQLIDQIVKNDIVNEIISNGAEIEKNEGILIFYKWRTKEGTRGFQFKIAKKAAQSSSDSPHWHADISVIQFENGVPTQLLTKTQFVHAAVDPSVAPSGSVYFVNTGYSANKAKEPVLLQDPSLQESLQFVLGKVDTHLTRQSVIRQHLENPKPIAKLDSPYLLWPMSKKEFLEETSRPIPKEEQPKIFSDPRIREKVTFTREKTDDKNAESPLFWDIELYFSQPLEESLGIGPGMRGTSNVLIERKNNPNMYRVKNEPGTRFLHEITKSQHTLIPLGERTNLIIQPSSDKKKITVTVTQRNSDTNKTETLSRHEYLLPEQLYPLVEKTNEQTYQYREAKPRQKERPLTQLDVDLLTLQELNARLDAEELMEQTQELWNLCEENAETTTPENPSNLPSKGYALQWTENGYAYEARIHQGKNFFKNRQLNIEIIQGPQTTGTVEANRQDQPQKTLTQFAIELKEEDGEFSIDHSLTVARTGLAFGIATLRRLINTLQPAQTSETPSATSSSTPIPGLRVVEGSFQYIE